MEEIVSPRAGGISSSSPLRDQRKSEECFGGI
jgi:hypothetical protein